MDLEMMIIKILTATVVVEGSVAATKEVLHEALDFAFLDVASFETSPLGLPPVTFSLNHR